VLGGFEGVEFNPAEVADLVETHGLAYVQDTFTSAGVKPSGWGLPTDWRGTQEAFDASLAHLPRLAAASAALGCTRVVIWIMPSGDLPLEENWAFHVSRLGHVAKVLAEHGLHLGLEFIGPRTALTWGKYPFVHTLPRMRELANACGENVGILLDCWHWHTSGATVDDITACSAHEIVYVHVNDAPEGLTMDEYQDGDRRLPGQTGVIDSKGFLQALDKIGYDGPVVAEPFHKPLNDLPSDEARLKTIADSLNKIFALR
jgi:hypothetical protein